MADDKFSAGLTDQDEMSQFPSAVNPLTALGIDPDMARANPALLAALNPAGLGGDTPQPKADAPSIPGALAMPSGEPDASVATAAKVGGAGDAPQAAPTTTPAAPTTATDYGMAGLASLNQNADLATQAAKDIPTSNPEVDRLAAMKEKLGTQAPLYDTKTGKMLSQTTVIDPATGQPTTIDPKPTTGTRIWRGVRGGLQGLLTGGIRGGLLGAIDPALEGSQAYGAPNSAYQKAEQQREGKAAATDSNLDTAFKNWKDQMDATKARIGEFRADGTLGKDLTTGSVGMQNAATAAQKANTAQQVADNKPDAQPKTYEELVTAANLEKDPAKKAAYQSAADQIQKTEVKKFSTQAPRPSAEEQENASLTAAWRKEHPGQPLTVDVLKDLYARRGSGKGDPNSDDEASSIVADATAKKQQFADGYERNPDGSYNKKGTFGDPKEQISAKQFQDKLDGFRNDANVKLAKKGAQIDEQGNIVHKDSADNPQGDVVTVQTSDGKGGMITGTIPRANLAAAQKRDPKLKMQPGQ
jgi:hypothetical protein